jgi:hypothetical protein
MAGVIAHRSAIVSSANARILVTLISVLCFLITTNKFLLPTIMLGRPGRRCSDGDHLPEADNSRCRPVHHLHLPFRIRARSGSILELSFSCATLLYYS